MTLVDAGAIVICGGGGGIPVVRRCEGRFGVDAVVDKDATSELVAESVHADLLVLATGTDVCRFVTRTGQRSVIGALTAIPELVSGEAGTVVTPR